MTSSLARICCELCDGFLVKTSVDWIATPTYRGLTAVRTKNYLRLTLKPCIGKEAD